MWHLLHSVHKYVFANVKYNYKNIYYNFSLQRLVFIANLIWFTLDYFSDFVFMSKDVFVSTTRNISIIF